MFQPRGVYTSEMTSFTPWKFQTLSAYGIATFLLIVGTQLAYPIIGYTNTLRYHLVPLSIHQLDGEKFVVTGMKAPTVANRANDHGKELPECDP